MLRVDQNHLYALYNTYIDVSLLKSTCSFVKFKEQLLIHIP